MKTNLKPTIIYARMIAFAFVLLLVLLLFFQSVWVLGGSGTAIMNATGLQRTRAERISKDVLILAHRVPAEYPAAMNELQNTLPPFEAAQTGLRDGSAALNLTSFVPPDVKLALAQSVPSFVAVDTAARRIALQNSCCVVDMVQVNIVLQFEQQYVTAMNTVNMIWQDHIDSAFLHLFLIKSGIASILLLATVGGYRLLLRPSLMRLAAAEA